MLPGKQFGNQYGSNEPIDDDVRFINYSFTETQASTVEKTVLSEK